MSVFNLPNGCLPSDIDGPRMPTCEKCGCEHNDEKNNGLCHDCQPEPCPKCGSVEIVKRHTAGTFALPECWFKQCEDCDFIFDQN